MDEFNEGQKVTVTIVGEILTDNGSIISVKELSSGKNTYLYKNAVSSITEMEPPLIPGEAYVDADGDKLIYREDAEDTDRPWVDAWGNLVNDDFPTKPVRLLV